MHLINYEIKYKLEGCDFFSLHGLISLSMLNHKGVHIPTGAALTSALVYFVTASHLMTFSDLNQSDSSLWEAGETSY